MNNYGYSCIQHAELMRYRAKSRTRFQYLMYFRNISRFILYFKNQMFIKMNLRFNIFISKDLACISKTCMACHSRGKSVPCGSYNNLDNKPEITCNNINGGNRKYAI